MFQINLVPEVQQQKQTQAKRNTYATFFSVSLIVLTVALMIIMGSIRVYQNLRLDSVKKKIQTVESESEKYKELEETVLSLEAGLKGVRNILDGQNSWTRLLPHLEMATPTDATYTSINMLGNKIEANLKGQTIDSLAKYIESYKNYKVIVVRGKGKMGDIVNAEITGSGQQYKVTVNSLGHWVIAVPINSSQVNQVTISWEEKKNIINLDPATGSISSDKKDYGDAELINLFEEVNTSKYSNKDSQITFDATFSFREDALW